MEGAETETIVCTSQTITSSGIDTGITYGGAWQKYLKIFHL